MSGLHSTVAVLCLDVEVSDMELKGAVSSNKRAIGAVALTEEVVLLEEDQPLAMSAAFACSISISDVTRLAGLELAYVVDAEVDNGAAVRTPGLAEAEREQACTARAKAKTVRDRQRVSAYCFMMFEGELVWEMQE